MSFCQLFPSGSAGSVGSAVIGRACTNQTVPAAAAHSMSCGRPNEASTARAASATATAISSGRPPSSPSMRSPRTVTSEPTTSPCTSASPSPSVAAIRTTSRSPVTGSAVNATPAQSAGTSRCSTTAASPLVPCSRAACADASRQWRIAASVSPVPATPRTVAVAPACALVAPSSQVADVRTASAPPSRAQAWSTATRSSSGAGPPLQACAMPTGRTTPSGTANEAARSRASPAALVPQTVGSPARGSSRSTTSNVVVAVVVVVVVVVTGAPCVREGGQSRPHGSGCRWPS